MVFQAGLDKTDKDGITVREHYESVERQTGRRPIGLDGPKFPNLMGHVWSAFLCLHGSRSFGFAGPNPITYLEVKAFMDTTGAILSGRDVEAIMELDKAFLKIRAKEDG